MNSLLKLMGLAESREVDSILSVSWKAMERVPIIYLYLFIIIGTALALVNFLPWVRMRTSLRVWTFFLRLGMVGLMLAILHRLELNLELGVLEKQNWTVLVDDSGSMATKDEQQASRHSVARRDLATIQRSVGPQVRLKAETVSGRALGKAPGQGRTLMRTALRRTALAEPSPDRMIFLTDGRDSEGRDLAAIGERIKARGVKLHTRLYGSHSPPRDIGIFAEADRSLIRLGERAAFRCSIASTGPAASSATVALKANGKTMKTVDVLRKDFHQFTLSHKPEKEGVVLYSVEVKGHDPLPVNNMAQVKVEVVNSRIKVLMIEGYPRFEFKLFKTVLEVDPLIELVTICQIPGGGVYVQGEALHRNPKQGLISSQADLFRYDVIILRDVSRRYYREGGDVSETRLQNLVAFVKKRGGGLLVMGGQDVYRAGGYEKTSLAEVLPFDLSDAISKESQFPHKFYASLNKAAYFHPIFRLEEGPIQNRELLDGLTQLDGSNNVGRFKPFASPLMTRTAKVKNVRGELDDRPVPLMAYVAVGDGKVIGAAVDTFWRWQLLDEFDGPPLEMLLANMIRYVAPPPGKRAGAPDISIADGTPQVGQELLLSTVLKDKNHDPIRRADLEIRVTSPDKSVHRIFPRDLPEEPGYYEYRIPIEQPGGYHVEAIHGKEKSTRSFVAGAAASEFADLSVDREGMKGLLKASGGEEIASLEEWLKRIDVRPHTKQTTKDLEVWNSPLALVLFMLLVCLDCYLRKRQGLA